MTPIAATHNGTGISIVSVSFELLMLEEDDDGMFVLIIPSVSMCSALRFRSGFVVMAVMLSTFEFAGFKKVTLSVDVTRVS